ncbi:MAG: carboxypeptidase regulatory-like domain-containing protein, partial [Chitinophagia bacterium]|nr:carboxypeptidase regulatory-like domain-containing protein [Chitinophagia bacterium]
MKHILASFLLFVSMAASAQVSRQVTGRLVDSSGAALPRANVKLYTPGARDTMRAVTNNNGAFLFKSVPSPRFAIVASNIGFTAAEKSFSFAATLEDIRLDAIVMTPSVTTLQEVVVTTPPIVIKEDTVEYKIDSSMVKPNSMVEDLLKKLPGIEVDKSGNITAQGKSVTRVKVNGKDFFGGDPKAATRELPADIVDKVQIIDDYGDLANISGIKDGEPEKVLNIQIKKERNKGVFGRATGGYGTSDRYQATLNTNIFNGNRQFSVTGNLNNSNASVFNQGGGGGGMDLNAGGVGRAMVA